MNMKKYIILLIAAMSVGLTSCKWDYFPSDELNADVLLTDEGGAQYIVDGCYAVLKDEIEYIGYASGNSYVRHYSQLAEFPADNTCLSSKTEDPLYEATAYMMTDNLKNLGTLWYLSYKVAYMANTVIESLGEGKNAKADQLVGECYFLRALMHFHLVTLYAKPYSHGRENMGIPMRVSTNTEETTRASVGECYDQIVADLKKAAELMTPSSARGNKGYANHDAALGLLARVYLYMEENQKVIDTYTELLGGADPATKIEDNASFANFFANAKTSKETLFCVAHEAIETKGQSSAGSMYLNDGIGWGEIYPSAPLLNLFERYPEDIRYTAFIKPQYSGQEQYNVTFPDPSTPNDAAGRLNLAFKCNEMEAPFTFNADGKKYTVDEITVNGEYKEYQVNFNGTICAARVTKALKNRNSNPIYYVTKYSYQDGDPMLSSPVYARWGEVILCAAEAYAKLNQNDKALELVNVIRRRAGIREEGMFSADKMHGYESVLDVVLDERRLELCFEGHRMFDVYRNKRSMDRRYPGAQPWAVMNYDDNRIQYPIPHGEYSVSGIQQNPGY